MADHRLGCHLRNLVREVHRFVLQAKEPLGRDSFKRDILQGISQFPAALFGVFHPLGTQRRVHVAGGARQLEHFPAPGLGEIPRIHARIVRREQVAPRAHAHGMARQVHDGHHRLAMLQETGDIDIMVHRPFLLAAVPVDPGPAPADFQFETLALGGDGLRRIVHDGFDHPLLPRPVGAARHDGRAPGAWGGMRVDIVHQDVVQGEARPLRDHRPDRVGNRRGNLHQVVRDDAYLLRAVPQHQAVREQMLVDAVRELVAGREAGQHDMLVLRRGNVGGAIAHRQSPLVAGED